MTKNADNATRSQPTHHLHGDAPADAPGPSADPKTPDLSGFDREIEIFALTPRQQSILPVVALSPNIAQASRDSGVSHLTLPNPVHPKILQIPITTLT